MIAVQNERKICLVQENERKPLEVVTRTNTWQTNLHWQKAGSYLSQQGT